MTAAGQLTIGPRAIFILPAASIAGGVVLFFGVRTVLRDIAFVAARTTATHPVVLAGPRGSGAAGQ